MQISKARSGERCEQANGAVPMVDMSAAPS